MSLRRPRTPWRAYRRLVVGGAVGLAAAALLGFAALGTPLLEVFPFYSWILFPVEPNGKGYQVYIERVGEKWFAPPLPFNQAEGVVRNPRSVVLFRVIQRLGRACREGNEAEVVRQRGYLEAAMEPGTVYGLTAVEADPITLWKTKQPARETPLRTFFVP
ncbi:hypothetical protein SAMN05444156_2752 [Verrucomicrobium sp. GAS474]|uniref:hypothetical protein n=1 Tax=Verrucomicrobium sp. GAS474 TaxID=1882831 RepID=UPI00087B80B3|nr:hypothetical protein [Verrucomicrobium sp. GAS474]SDU23247.1 hypothetical protein SAMN05444156_2752 [Verrucomicrobium sp. GAS474]